MHSQSYLSGPDEIAGPLTDSTPILMIEAPIEAGVFISEDLINK
ncbi:MAG: hypothetical protein ACOVOR_05020 [Rhabdochlamydiaceae bacterium]